MGRRSFTVLAGALVAGASLLVANTSASVAGPAGQEQKPKRGGTVTFGADQEPGTLNTYVVGGDHLWASAAHYPVMAGTFQITPRFTYSPDLVTKVKFTRRPFTTTYFIKKNARWSDGKPVTAQDYVFTLKTIMDKRWNIISTIGYEDIASFKIINKKTVKFTYKKVFAGWRDLFSGVLPKHALEGQDFNAVWKNGITNPKTNRPIGNGPFLLTAWNRGSSMVFTRNKNYWGPRPYLNSIVFRFVEDTNTQVQQIRGGELDILSLQPQLAFAPLRAERSIKVLSTPGPGFEKLDFNQGFKGGGNPLLKNKFIREAISRGLDRQAIVRTVLGPVNPSLRFLDSVIIPQTSPYYKRHWLKYSYNPGAARRLMESNGCRRGGDGIYVCAGARASFRWSGTTGNQRRELTFEIAQAQLKNVGIELKSHFGPPAVVFRNYLVNGNFDIADYAWSLGSPDLSGFDSIYGCRTETEAQQNNMGYCNRRVDALMKRVSTELDQRRQAVIMNQALALLANDLAILPLYPLPSFVIHKRTVRNVKDNPLSVGVFWNLNKGGWWKQ